MLSYYSSDIGELQAGRLGVPGSAEGHGVQQPKDEGPGAAFCPGLGGGGAACRRESTECVGESQGSEKGELCEVPYPEMGTDRWGSKTKPCVFMAYYDQMEIQIHAAKFSNFFSPESINCCFYIKFPILRGAWGLTWLSF